MASTFRAACIQFSARPEIGPNLETGIRLSREAAARGAKLIALPEYFSGLATQGHRLLPTAFRETDHPAIPAFKAVARELSAWILLGSLAVVRRDGRIANRAYLIDAEGEITARYDKIHLFDVDLGEGKLYRESETIAPGSVAVVADTPWGGLGLSICYDLRFPQLFRRLAHQGASMLAVPAGFTRLTGEAHWHVLCRARAIENGAYVIAPCQNGVIEGGGECFGHSLIVDPWGEIIADGGEGEGVVVAEIDPQAVIEARRRIPALTHDRDFTADGIRARPVGRAERLPASAR